MVHVFEFILYNRFGRLIIYSLAATATTAPTRPPSRPNATRTGAYEPGLAADARISSQMPSMRAAIWTSPKLSRTRATPVWRMRSRSAGDSWVRTRSMTSDQAATSLGDRSQPVSPSSTVSVGPPVSAARTGRPASMASRGTMPKCSLAGV